MDDDFLNLALDLLDTRLAMVLATVRPDGYPQATTMNYVHKGLSLYIYCDVKTQKTRNLTRNPKVSGALDCDPSDWTTMRNLSFGGVASRVTAEREIDLATTMHIAKYPQMLKLVPKDFQHPICFRIDLVALTVLDYRQSFGHSKTYVLQDGQWMPRSA